MIRSSGETPLLRSPGRAMMPRRHANALPQRKKSTPCNPPSPCPRQRNRRRSATGSRLDLLVVIAVTLGTFALSAGLELREWLTEITHPLERYQIDELPLTFGALALSLAWFSWRRWRHAEDELSLRVAAQRALAEREAQYRTLFMENLAGTTLASPDGTLQLCNPAMARILGLRHPDHAVGRNLAEFYADGRAVGAASAGACRPD